MNKGSCQFILLCVFRNTLHTKSELVFVIPHIIKFNVCSHSHSWLSPNWEGSTTFNFPIFLRTLNCNCWLHTVFHIWFVGIFFIHARIRFHTLSSTGSLVSITLQPKNIFAWPLCCGLSEKVFSSTETSVLFASSLHPPTSCP